VGEWGAVGRVTIDLSFMPIFMVVHEGVLTDREFKDYLRDVERTLYGPDAKMRVLVQDARTSGQVPAIQRKMQADWLKQHEARLRDLTLGSAFVIDSALVRGLLTAILWLQPLPMPHEVCATIEGALDWADTKLKDRGLAVTPALRSAVLAKYGVRRASVGT